jgi:hypothetical protein
VWTCCVLYILILVVHILLCHKCILCYRCDLHISGFIHTFVFQPLLDCIRHIANASQLFPNTYTCFPTWHRDTLYFRETIRSIPLPKDIHVYFLLFVADRTTYFHIKVQHWLSRWTNRLVKSSS